MKTLLILITGLGLAFASYAGTTNDTASAEHLLTRAYNISATISIEAFVGHLKHLEPPQSGESDQALLLRFLKQQHVEIQKPAVVFLDEKDGKLFVHTTQPDQDKIQALFEKILYDK